MSENEMSKVSWIARLPGAGGDWGKGIVGTVRLLEEAIAESEAKKEDLDERLAQATKSIAEAKAQIDADIKAKKKLLKATVKRANAEAPTMFANAQIAEAQSENEAGPGSAAEAEA